MLSVSNRSLTIPNSKTISSRLWDKFNKVLCSIQDTLSRSEHIVLNFDGWSTSRNHSVTGFIVTFLDQELKLKSRCVGNFRMLQTHGSKDICSTIKRVVAERLNKIIPVYFVSDSAPSNKAAVRMFMEEEEGDEH